MALLDACQTLAFECAGYSPTTNYSVWTEGYWQQQDDLRSRIHTGFCYRLNKIDLRHKTCNSSIEMFTL